LREENGFIDYYELLQVSSNADSDTIERVFRHLAKKFHPDNKESGDTDRFQLIVEAHRTLSNLESRAGYDVKFQEYWNRRWKIASVASNGSHFGDDGESREKLLSVLYVQRRRDMKNPGLGDYELARLLSLPFEAVEFHLWYLKAKGLVERLDSGRLAISALGVDEVEQGRFQLRTAHMLPEGDAITEGTDGQTTRLGPPDFIELPRDIELNQE
jgi:curved DNA-binding protein CbpA